ncbi:Na(+)-translocating NADH-quinone reductase subunit A [Roseimaritima multifibrata]|uniref:Na(+)-translocating NADH-quinone reductase subunit A n=1 Tax=Roseimaritima multifibrata TaxID=1930274 RepID=A0A517MJE5_9BACT|nr:Na(+)-translocating NADH-quinone reductase subunit A [Roseimaritima multifibrata]QDS95025.1 Na(+)-translocating NADH-quinone reductase subunit A [Roseimaritima multifibrata]
MTVIKKGLNLPITGSPEQRVEQAPHSRQVALIGDDYIGMRPTMLVQPGDRVQLGQPVFEDKKTEGVVYTAPAAGVVAAVNRGAKRKFESLVIDVDGDEAVDFGAAEPRSLDRDAIIAKLTASGLWSAFRTRPFGRVPLPSSQPHSIFVQAMDTNPLAADPVVALAERNEEFTQGLLAIQKLTDGSTFVCKNRKSEIPGDGVPGVRVEIFEGPHPAGLPGTHIHTLDPVGPTKTVWYINYQDVAAIGSLLRTGRLDTRRVISLAGPMVTQPRLLETRLGAEIGNLVAGQIDPERTPRIISGSVLNGRTATEPVNFLGRYSNQISVIEEGDHREFLGWQMPGFDKFSTTRVYAASMLKDKKFDFTSSTGGSERAMVPLGTYEKVMPLDILATQLLRSLIVRDTEQAQLLGALELEEEDLALCTFVCPGKYEYGSILRDNLTTIEQEG